MSSLDTNTGDPCCNETIPGMHINGEEVKSNVNLVRQITNVCLFSYI